jgi:hypothetical protein
MRLMQVVAKTFKVLCLPALCEPAFTLILSICLLLFLSVICLVFDQFIICFLKTVLGFPPWKSVYLKFLCLVRIYGQQASQTPLTLACVPVASVVERRYLLLGLCCILVTLTVVL